MDRLLPDEEAEHREDNRRFFFDPQPGGKEPLGSPGGAQKTGQIGIDTERVAGTPQLPSSRTAS